MSSPQVTIPVPGHKGPAHDMRIVIEQHNSHPIVSATMLSDGRVNVQLTGNESPSSKHRKKRWKPPIHIPVSRDSHRTDMRYPAKIKAILDNFAGIPRLNIAIQIVGSRGDVQPFIAIGQILSKPPYSHRVRICTHLMFKDFVEKNGLEFFSIGGDPAALMAYMVKNPGLLPGKESWKAGEVGKRRADIAHILEGCWRSCIESGNGVEIDPDPATSKAGTDGAEKLFIADAIIANPPSYGHIHCAEKLGIPLHMIFTMPWSPTQYFPHPLATIEGSGPDPNLTNYLSFPLMELLAWQGLSDVINGFRVKTLHLEPVDPLRGHMLLHSLKVPFTYLWSPALIPKPLDWGPHVNITGFSFLKAPSSYEPPQALVEFLNSGPEPIYIGFGSIVVDQPDKLTEMIFGAVRRLRVRALVSQGWGGFGGKCVPKDVFLLGDCPHDWIFQFVSCVVHHGGAGTTAIGISMGKPTVVVPFFGDQPFWGSMVYRAGAGPEPIPFKKLTEESLAESIAKALAPEIANSAKVMSEKIASENGAQDTAMSFHKSADFDAMRCPLSPGNITVWGVKKTNLRLSSLAAATLVDYGHLSLSDLKLLRHKEWDVDRGVKGFFTGTVTSIAGSIGDVVTSTREYSRKMSRTVGKGPVANSLRGASTVKAGLAPSETEGPFKLPNHFPVTAAAGYTSQYLELVAYQMAAHALPHPKNRSNLRKTCVRQQNQRTEKTHSTRSEATNHGPLHNALYETCRYGVLLLGVGLKVPVDFLYNLATDLHNAPLSIFHDDMVRRLEHIDGIESGVKAAGKGLALNLFDAFTGLVVQPYRGAKKEAVAGFGKGIGKGFGGLLFKITAAAVGVPAYILKGVEQELGDNSDRSLKAKIIAVRLRQGMAAYQRASEKEKEEILVRWVEIHGSS